VQKYGQLLYSENELKTAANSATHIVGNICNSPRTPCKYMYPAKNNILEILFRLKTHLIKQEYQV